MLNQQDKTYSIGGTPTTITACIYDRKTYTLGAVVTKGYTTLLGKAKAENDCSVWAYTTADHYLTTTGDISGCTKLLWPDMAYGLCMNGLGSSINEIT